MLKGCLLVVVLTLLMVAAVIAGITSDILSSRFVWGPIVFGLASGYAVLKDQRKQR